MGRQTQDAKRYSFSLSYEDSMHDPGGCYESEPRGMTGHTVPGRIALLDDGIDAVWETCWPPQGA